MAIRGSASKETITRKILETFPGAFKYDKEIRIPMVEDGAEVQIKITLIAAKTNVEPNGDVALPGGKPESQPTKSSSGIEVPTEPSEEEKENLQKLIANLF